MSLEAQSSNTAFAPGSDLWIVPERKSSNWVQRLDWYLNFQIAKSSQHQSHEIPSEVIDILKNCSLEGYDWVPKETKALLILASPYVPARWVMVLKDSDHFESWVKEAAEKWKKMNSPSVRVFLPHNASSSQFQSLWKKAGGTDAVTVVTDSEGSAHG